MCGIVGIAGDMGLDEIKAFKNLLAVDTIRGKHATGVFYSRDGKSIYYDKMAVSGPEFLEKSCINFDRMYGVKLAVGHNRHATVGKNDDPEGAHPFDFTKVIGVHNGTMNWGWEYDIPGGNRFDIDSQAVYNYINDNIDNFQEVYKNLDGAMALCFYNKFNRTLEFIRNTERTLYFTFSKDGKTLFWASEDWMLEGVLKRNKIQHGDINLFEAHIHYSIDPVELALTGSKFKAKKMEPYKNFTYPRLVTTPSGVGATGSAGNGALVDAYGTLEEKELMFEISELCTFNSANKNTKKHWFYKGEVLNDVDINQVRMFYQYQPTNMKNKLSINMKNFKKYLRGKVCVARCSIYKDYATVIPSSLKIYSWDDPIIEKFLTEDEEYETVVKAFDNNYVNKEEWDELTKDGCSWCSCDLPFEDHNDVFWLNEDTPLCRSCDNNDMSSLAYGFNMKHAN